MSTLVTGEAVALDLRLARFPSRAVAIAIDLTLQVGMLLGLFLLLGLVAGSIDPTLGVALSLTLFVLVVVGYPTLLETLTHGRTIGKMVFGLRVVRDDGGPTRFRHAFVRALCAFAPDIWISFGSVACITSLINSEGKRVGDLFAGTVVVRERVPAPASVQSGTVWMPPSLAGWAATADLSRVPDDLALMARQFLVRAPSLDPATRVRMAAQTATTVAGFVAPATPPGTPAEAYLAAVVAERSRRADTLARAAPPMAPTPVAPAPVTPTPAIPPAAAPAVRAPAVAPAPEAPPPGGFAPPW